MRKKLLLGVTALAIAAGVGMAPKADAQPFFDPQTNAFPVFGNPPAQIPIFLNEATSPGTPFFATIGALGNAFAGRVTNPDQQNAILFNSGRLGRGLINAGFNPTSPTRWPFLQF